MLNTKIVAVNPNSNVNPFANVSATDVIFRRTTDRYNIKGTFSNNKGYLCVGRGDKGRFVSVMNKA